MGKVVLEREHGRQDAGKCLLPCVLEGEFEQIMTKIRWSVKENNNYITAELQVLLTFILYFLQILRAYFYPIQTLRFY